MIRILHTADVHLDSPLKSLALRDESLRETVEAATRAAFTRIIDIALSERVTALLIAGDLFDGKQRSARTGAFLIGQLDRLRTADIRVFYIKGNHDAENPIIGTLDLPDNVHTFDARGGKVKLTEDIWIHGVSFADRHAPESLLPRFSAPVEGAINIAVLHTSLTGAVGHDVYAPCSLSDLLSMNFDYWALGHIHKRHVHAEVPWVVMPGMPQGRDIGETGTKSASLLTITDGKIHVEEVQTSVVEFSTSALDITTAENNDALRALIRGHLRTTASTLASTAGVLRLTLTGTPIRHWQILRDQEYWREQVAELAREMDCLWMDKLIFDISVPSTTNNGVSTATEELSKTMETIRGEPGFVIAAQTEVDLMLMDLPSTIRARLLPDEAAAKMLIHKLTKTGSQQMLARMKGATS
ncbi:MAG: DNA repair exonuclease [Rhizobiales bacterium]|nr:DNA repair exonuclease [Hyphomicrobiales bacterium]NRB15114.1 DNA repair exonuclease [Hyphomicrobiales bacterium]